MAKASEWAARVAQWRASGKKAAEFCQEQGYSRQSLHWWSSYFRRKGALEPSGRAVRLARVIRAPAMAESLMPPAIIVHVGRARVEVTAGVDRAALTAVFDALTSASQEGCR
jgi:hypothetical protein